MTNTLIISIAVLVGLGLTLGFMSWYIRVLRDFHEDASSDLLHAHEAAMRALERATSDSTSRWHGIVERVTPDVNATVDVRTDGTAPLPATDAMFGQPDGWDWSDLEVPDGERPGAMVLPAGAPIPGLPVDLFDDEDERLVAGVGVVGIPAPDTLGEDLDLDEWFGPLPGRNSSIHTPFGEAFQPYDSEGGYIDRGGV